MADIYLRVYERLPRFLKRRINPLEYGIEDFVRSARPSSGSALVLDAGSGEMRFSKFFAGHRYLALDSRVGDSRWNYSGIDLCADVEAIPLVDSSVDLLLNLQVLEHVPSPSATIREFYRVLRPGGRLYLTAPQGWHEHQQPHDFFRFTRYSLQLLLEAAGFKDYDIQPLGGYFHYLGHRLTYIPKILFAGRRGLLRLLLLPLEVASLALFCLVCPVVCYYLDGLDAKKEFTLGYRCLAIK